MNNAVLLMRSAPSYIDKPVYEDYMFNRVGIETKKTFRGKCYIINSVENCYSTKDVLLNEKRNFTILYGLHENDVSITRGVASAIRKLPSKYAPDANKVLFIQTDASINPGNYGGPLFLGDKVIGVNTQKPVETEIEGLGFAIHYSEVLNFINSNL